MFDVLVAASPCCIILDKSIKKEESVFSSPSYVKGTQFNKEKNTRIKISSG